MQPWEFTLDASGYATQVLESAGFTLLNEDGVLLCSNPAGATAFVTSGALKAGIVAKRVEEVKEKASEHILAKYPIWKQMNMNMRAVELVNIVLQRAWTTDEQTEALALQTTAAWIKSVRTYSNTLETALSDPLKTWEQVAAYDINAGWPA